MVRTLVNSDGVAAAGSWKTIRLRITPAANRNSYRVASLVGVLTQGSVLRPQPWAGKSQLLQSCCCLRIAYNNSPCCFCLLGHAPFFTIPIHNKYMDGDIGTAIIIIMIYYKKNGALFRAN